MMKTFIVDDEKPIVNTIKILLEKIGGFEIVGTAHSVAEATQKIPESNADLLFLDVELQDGLSFDILSQLNHKDYHIVFITAHSHYAMQAIRFSAFDYILKPIHPDDLKRVCDRLKTEKTISLETRVKALEDNLNSQSKSHKIVLKSSEKYIIVKTEEIIHLEADNIYTTVFLKDNRRIVVSKALKHFESLLVDHGFYRSHRSHLVNISEISEYVKTDGGFLIMSNSKQVPVSTNKIQDLLEKL